MWINRLYISVLCACWYFRLFSVFSVVWLFLGTFLFLVCFLIPFFIRTFVAGNNE